MPPLKAHEQRAGDSSQPGGRTANPAPGSIVSARKLVVAAPRRGHLDVPTGDCRDEWKDITRTRRNSLDFAGNSDRPHLGAASARSGPAVLRSKRKAGVARRAGGELAGRTGRYCGVIGGRGGRVVAADPAHLVKKLAEIVKAEIEGTAAATTAINQIRQTPSRP